MTPRVYLDAVVIIYLVEQNPAFAPAVTATLVRLDGDLITNELARMEALVLPMRNNDPMLASEFEDFFRIEVAELHNLTRAIFDRAIHLRAAYGALKAPDALHLATAIETHCDVYVTNDKRLRNFPGIRVEVI